MGVNLLSNGGFETGGSGGNTFASWTNDNGDGTIADEGTLILGGAHAAKLTAGASANTFLYQIRTVTPGLTYTYSFWTRGDGTRSGRYGVFDNTHSAWLVGFNTSTGVAGTTYALVNRSFQAPAGCTQVALYCQCPATNAGIAYFDDVSLEVKPRRTAAYKLLMAR